MPRNSLDAIMNSLPSPLPAQRKQPVNAVDMTEEDVLQSIISADIPLILTVGLGDWNRDKFAQRVQQAMGKKMLMLSADDHFVTDGNYKFDPSQLILAHRQCQGSVRNALYSGKTVMVTNTHCRVEHIKTYADFKYPFIVIQFLPDSVSSAIAKGIGNSKQIPTHVFQQVFNDMMTLQSSLNSDVFPKLHAAYTVRV